MKKVLTGADSEEWYDAMLSEIQSIIRNYTRELVKRQNVH